MSFESMTSGYPVVGAFIGKLLNENPNAAHEALMEVITHQQPFANYNIDNEDLCRTIALEMTDAYEDNDGEATTQAEAFLNGIKWAIVISNQTKTKYATLIRLGVEDADTDGAIDSQKIVDRSLEAIENFEVLSDAVEECLPYVDERPEYRDYCRVGMYVGFLLIDNGYRETVRKTPQRNFSGIFTFEPETLGNTRYGLDLN